MSSEPKSKVKENIVTIGYGLAPKSVFAEPKISGLAKALFGLLSSYQGNNDNSYPSTELLAYQLNLNVRTVYKLIKELSQFSWFEKKQKRIGGKFYNNVYKINFDLLIQDDSPCVTKLTTVQPTAVKPTTMKLHYKNNNLKNNSLKNNNLKNNSYNNNINNTNDDDDDKRNKFFKITQDLAKRKSL